VYLFSIPSISDLPSIFDLGEGLGSSSMEGSNSNLEYSAMIGSDHPLVLMYRGFLRYFFGIDP